ncbi:MAG: hypothetical protein H6Q17_395 [Bacteroidetes bacterium]|nr:hypothetical protein [Bacteroidota bacterium]
MILGLIVSLALAITSCEKETITRGTLDYKFVPVTASDGYFQERQIAYPENITISGYANSINDFSFLGSMVEVTGNLMAGDVIRGLVIDIDGVQYLFPDIPVYKNGEVISLVDSRSNGVFYHFMSDAINDMRHYGKQDIIVSGYLEDRYGRDVAGATVAVNIYNDLDVRVNN